MKTRRKVIIGVLAVPLIYVASYFLNSFAGGYWLRAVRDGKHLWPHGLSMHDAVQWQPRFGYVERYERDFLGTFFFPLIRIDQTHWHRTFYMIDEKDFYFVTRDISPSLVHPKFREEYRKNKKEPNEAVVPRRLLVTDRAYARSAPSNRLAHLER